METFLQCAVCKELTPQYFAKNTNNAYTRSQTTRQTTTTLGPHSSSSHTISTTYIFRVLYSVLAR